MVIFGLPKPPKELFQNVKRRNTVLQLFLQLLRLTRNFPLEEQRKYKEEIRKAFKTGMKEKSARKINEKITAAKDAVVQLGTKIPELACNSYQHLQRFNKDKS
jgi:two-component sensor histidine kinase